MAREADNDTAESRAIPPPWHVVLRALREGRGITQDGLAARLGYGRRSVRRWEAGESTPDATAEEAFITWCREQGLFRHFASGPLQGVQLTPELLRGLLADGRGALGRTRLSRARSAPLATPAPAPERAPDTTTGRATPVSSLSSLVGFPLTLTRFFGREQELDTLVALLRVQRLVTLTGPGGVGKTRLALEAAHRVVVDFEDGAVFVSLAPVRDAGLVDAAIAQALGLAETATRAIRDAVCDALRTRRLLLVLDNFEHLIDAAPTVLSLLVASAGLVVLATSREALRLSGEHEVAIRPLPLPASAAPQALSLVGLLANDAVRLFADRAQAVCADFRLSAENAATIAAVCARLDGLPLAIELAAVRVKALSIDTLLARLASRLPLLTAGPRDLPTRQQTLHETIAWSFELLPAAERALFCRLSVFVGGWTLAAAEAIGTALQTAASTVPRCAPAAGMPVAAPLPTVLDLLVSLVDKSLVGRDGQSSEQRFRMLETIREYAHAQLVASGEEAAARRAHAQYFLGVAEAGHYQIFVGASDLPVRLEQERENLRAALLHVSTEADGATLLRLAGALGPFWATRGYFAEGRYWLEAALHSPTTVKYGAPRARASMCLGDILVHQEQLAAARPLLDESIAIWRTAGEPLGLLTSLCVMGHCLASMGDLTGAQTYLTEAVGRGRRASAPAYHALSLFRLGQARTWAGDYMWAREHFVEAAALVADEAHVSLRALVLRSWGHNEARLGMAAQAATLFAESLVCNRQVRDDKGLAACIAALAGVAAAVGNADRATRLLSAAAAVLNDVELGRAFFPEDRQEYEQTLAAAKSALSESAFRACWEQGQHLGREDAIAEALAVAADATQPQRGKQ